MLQVLHFWNLFFPLQELCFTLPCHILHQSQFLIFVPSQFLRCVSSSFMSPHHDSHWISQQLSPLTDFYSKSPLSFLVHCECCCLMNISMVTFIILLLHSWLNNGVLYYIKWNLNSSAQHCATPAVWHELFSKRFLISFCSKASHGSLDGFLTLPVGQPFWQCSCLSSFWSSLPSTPFHLQGPSSSPICPVKSCMSCLHPESSSSSTSPNTVKSMHLLASPNCSTI